MDAKRTILGLAASLALCAGLQAQEPWEGGFKLTAASFPGSEESFLGQSRAYGLGMFGTYPLSGASSLAFEAGYRYLPTTVHTAPGMSYEDKSDGYYGGAFFQYRLLFEGFHLQAGARLSQFVTVRRANFLPGDGTSLLTKYRGNYVTGLKPVLGAGYRMNERYSFELNVGPLQLRNVDGVAKSGNLAEISFLVHL